MKTSTVILSGPTISRDRRLIDLFNEDMAVISIRRNSEIEVILRRQSIDAIVLEIPDDRSEEVEIIRTTRSQYPRIPIILIGGNRELLAKAVQNGVNDIFKKPYRHDLLKERVSALIK